MSIWRTYKNGNYTVHISTKNGTKVRETEDDEFIPDFAENMDVMTSTVCSNSCAWCYSGCSPNGKHGELLDWKFWDTLHPYTELALNLNFPMPPQFIELLHKLQGKHIIANVTIHQNHFEENHDLIKSLIDQQLIYGIGISLSKVTDRFLYLVKDFPTAVIHTINGITMPRDYLALADNNLKILILGYKDVGRGIEHHEKAAREIEMRQQWTYENLDWLTKHNKIVSFDNLALSQLEVKRLLTDEEWEEFFMGQDGGFTFFLDLVDGTFAKNSLATEKYPIMDSVDDMFKFIRNLED